MSTENTFEVRLAEAKDRATWRYVERGEFISDDDLLDIADALTTSDMSWLDDDDFDPLDPTIDTTDRDALLSALYAWLTPPPPDVFVWVVERGYDWEGQDAEGVFADRESALAAVEASYPNYTMKSDKDTEMELRGSDGNSYILVTRMKVGEL